MLFRKARSTDSSSIERLYRELVMDSAIQVNAERIDALLKNSETVVLVGEIQEAIVFSALIFFCPDVMYSYQPFAVVENFVVSSTARGNGIGSKLMAEIERLSIERNCTKIMLLSATNRLDAHRFFIRAGFSGERKRGFVKYRSQMKVSAPE